MTDTFEVQGDFAPVQTGDLLPVQMGDLSLEKTLDTSEPLAPNGFLKMGLAPELLRAVEDLGFTQPTGVQEQTIPLALPTDDEAAGWAGGLKRLPTAGGLPTERPGPRDP